MMRLSFVMFIFTIFITGCLPEQTVRAPVTNDETSLNNNNSGNDQNVADPAENNALSADAYWYSGANTLQTLTIDFDNSKSQYIFGDDVDKYLKEITGIKDYIEDEDGKSIPLYFYRYEDTFCLQVKFVQSTQLPNEIRVLAIPSSSLDFSTGIRTRYFRINLGSSSGNSSACNKNIKFENGILQAPPANLVFDTDDICPSCKNIISSASVTLLNFDENENVLKPVIDGDVKTSGLNLRVDMNGQAGSGSSSCTDTDCQAQGFDCCVNGQCINEGSVNLSGVSTDPAGFAQAEAEKDANPQWYLDYPQFYYACLERPPQDDDDDPLDPSDPQGDADARLEALYNDYLCIEQLKEFAEEDPYVKDYTDSTLPVAGSNYSACSLTTTDNMYYQTVLKRMYDECGCAEKNDLSLMVRDCPAYYYLAEFEKDSLGNDTDEIRTVTCYTPPVDDGPLPFEDRDVIVNARTTPHRFFNEDNEEYTLAEPLPDGASSVQEFDDNLTEFTYLDDEKIFPVNGSFNMNSILGSIDVNLTKARPAKVIDVEFDKVYFLAAIEGFYTPCPSCSKDSWFSNFSAFPSTTQGHGVRASGFTTSRSEWGTNSSLANYEDLIFGRACWLPPTMVPFSHSAIDGNDGQDQRLNRLKTQAALYVNGYQRDWFGFNKGALIGSFDGVSWFAIGKNRIARATSDKLFLAINAPFADLANPNDLTVHVAEYDFISSAAKYDYKDTGEINDVDQNDGGLCQKFHQCEDDTDCITQLGWEYMCASVTQQRTKWPQFEPIGAGEVNDSERIGTIVEFLNQGELPPDSPTTKRCIYRGAGAPCRVDWENISSYNLRKSLSCAPNFYCAPVTANVFNKEVARFGNSLDSILEAKNHLVGRDTNQLGRPKDYIGANNGLPTAVINTLQENLQEMDNSIANQEGLCVPGKSLPSYLTLSTTENTNQIAQQKAKDPNGRTDYISQISGCNSTLYNIDRYASCPIIDDDGNYLQHKPDYLESTMNIILPESGSPLEVSNQRATQFHSLRQNVCGLENIASTTAIGPGALEEEIRNNSAFKLIYGRDLASSDTQIEPILAQNACFRRAGAVCHTDLDCAPGKKHFEVIDVINPDLFGNEAERKYWEEYLVCGQAQKEPRIDITDESTFEAFNSWDMSNNRCCREVGNDITMYSEDTPNLTETEDLRTDIYGGVNPNDPRRYSRYMNASPLMDNSDSSQPFVAQTLIRPNANTEKNAAGELIGDVKITDDNQWKPIAETAGRTCCGGGWVRKFADGSNDWTVNRLNLDVSEFKCLNYKTPLYLTEYPEAFDMKDRDVNQDLPYLCVDPSLTGAGCAQYTFEFGGDDDSPSLPELDTDFDLMMKIDSNLSSQDGDGRNQWTEDEWTHSFFGFFATDSYPNDDSTVMDFTQPYDERYEGNMRQMLAVRIPSFITYRNNNWDTNTPIASPLISNQLEIALSRPGHNQSDGEPVVCAYIQDSNVNNYDCNNFPLNSWGGLCSPFSFNEDTWNSKLNNAGVTEVNHTCAYMFDQRTRELRITYVPEVLCETANYDAVDGTGGCRDELPDDEEEEFYSNPNPLSLRITFKAAGTMAWEREQHLIKGGALDDASLGEEDIFHHRRSSKPGNAIYYLQKFSKFEYLGIPQMTYEPIFCNDNYQKMVPGLFKPELDNTANGGDNNGILTTFDWMNSTRTFRDKDVFGNGALGNWDINSGDGRDNPAYDPNEYYGDDVYRVGTSEEVDHPQIFSAHEFKCCLPLGESVQAGEESMCCSGYAAEVTEGDSTNEDLTGLTDVLTCALPIGTDLNVYFNRFVSGEGTDVLEAEDFNARTGEPLTTVEVQNKLRELGVAHCDSGGEGGGTVRQGGAFGDYDPEPTPNVTVGQSPKVFGIVDSQFDVGTANNVPAGFQSFQEGFRWNHHLYCAGGDN